MASTALSIVAPPLIRMTWQSRSAVADGAQDVEAACARHAQIDGGEVVVALPQLGERLGAVGTERHVEPRAFAH